MSVGSLRSIRALAAWLFLLPGVVVLQPAFGGWSGYLPALAGVTAGAGIAVLAVWRRWGIGGWAVALILAYYLLGGPLALTETTYYGVAPSIETLQRLTLLIFQSWKDLLSVATPAGELSGPQAAALLGGLLVAAASLGFALLTRAVIWPLLLPIGWLAFCIAFGVRDTPGSSWLGVALGVGLVAWLVAHRMSRERQANESFLIRRDSGLGPRAVKMISAVVVVLVAAAGAVAYSGYLSGDVNRKLLRDLVEPPLDLRDYPSALMKYRLYELTQKEEVLFRVSGAPEGGRLRVATMDSWDGITFHVSAQAGNFLRTGSQMPWHPEGDAMHTVVTVEGYEGPWVPTFGPAKQLTFSGERAAELTRSLFYNRDSAQAIATAGLTRGSVISAEVVPSVVHSAEARGAMAEAGSGSARPASTSRVPDAISSAASAWTEDAISTFDRLRIIEEKLRTDGTYSNGEDNRSASGHTAYRLAAMMGGRQLIGSDEQYASTMALMATELGIPTRVVLGFYPTEPTSDQWELTGEDAHVWVEADIDGYGWVVFDPTPDRDKPPQTETPKPKPKPKPQVDPPPPPPERIPDDPSLIDPEVSDPEDDDQDEDSGWLGYLIVAAVVMGSLTVLATPFIIIALLKVLRTRRRRERGAYTQRLAGAWADILDRARDMGFVAASNRTRRESVAELSQRYPEVDLSGVAGKVDSAIFGYGPPDEQTFEAIWEETDEAKRALLRTKAWYRRPAVIFSLRSFKKTSPQARLDRSKWRNVARGKGRKSQPIPGKEPAQQYASEE